MSEKKYSLEAVYKSIGENENLREVVDGIKEGYSQNDESFFHWWYDSNKGLGGKSPDDLCNEGEKGKKYLEKILMDMLTAAHGG